MPRIPSKALLKPIMQQFKKGDCHPAASSALRHAAFITKTPIRARLLGGARGLFPCHRGAGGWLKPTLRYTPW